MALKEYKEYITENQDITYYNRFNIKMEPLNLQQKQVLVGCILGDGHLYSYNGGKTYSFIMSQGGSGYLGDKHRLYLLHTYRIFKNLCQSGPSYRVNPLNPKKANSESWRFQTRQSKHLAFYGNLFYESTRGERSKNKDCSRKFIKAFNPLRFSTLVHG